MGNVYNRLLQHNAPTATSKTLGFKKIMVYKTPPGRGGGGVNHIWLVA